MGNGKIKAKLLKGRKADPCDHEWVVFSTALHDVYLMVVCVNCGVNGTVNDPSEDEWRRAFRAPSRPYKWEAKKQVSVLGFPKVCRSEQV
jgi:hypothetical protein